MEINSQEPQDSMPAQNSETSRTNTRDFDYSKLFTPVAIIIAGIIVAGTLYTIRPRTAPVADQAAATPNPIVNASDVSSENDPYIGQQNAPVTIFYWSDYQCPYCKQFEVTTLPSIIKDYVDTGKVKVVFKDFQFLDSYSTDPKRLDSQNAGMFARAVWALYPQQFYTWREAMFNKQDKENSDFGDEASIEALTKTIPGISTPAVVTYVNTNKVALQKEIDADKSEGAKFNISGTPSFVIGNGNPLIQGVAGYSDFATLIDTALKKAGK